MTPSPTPPAAAPAQGEDPRCIPIKLTVQPYPFDQADKALADLAHDRVTGVAVLRVHG